MHLGQAELWPLKKQRQSDVTTSQGMLIATRIRRSKEQTPLESLEGMWPC